MGCVLTWWFSGRQDGPRKEARPDREEAYVYPLLLLRTESSMRLFVGCVYWVEKETGSSSVKGV